MRIWFSIAMVESADIVRRCLSLGSHGCHHSNSLHAWGKGYCSGSTNSFVGADINEAKLDGLILHTDLTLIWFSYFGTFPHQDLKTIKFMNLEGSYHDCSCWLWVWAWEKRLWGLGCGYGYYERWGMDDLTR